MLQDVHFLATTADWGEGGGVVPLSKEDTDFLKEYAEVMAPVAMALE
jgi:hypothetical protein